MTIQIEKIIQKNITALAEHLPKHKNMWEKLLQEIKALLQILTYQSEEIIHVESDRGNYLSIQNFKELQSKLIVGISEEIDETLSQLGDKIKNLKQGNNDMKNRIDKLEESALELDWSSPSKIILGNELQPALGILLQCSLKYRTFFVKHTERIVHMFSNIDIKSREWVKEFKQSFDVNLMDPDVTYLLEITQHIK